MGHDKSRLLERLQSTISTWTNEVTGAHGALARQIAETKDQLAELSAVLEARDGGQALRNAHEEIKLLRSRLRGRETEAATAARRIEELQRNLAACQDEIAVLRRQPNIATAPGISQATLRCMSSSFEETNGQIEALEAELRLQQQATHAAEARVSELEAVLVRHEEELVATREEKAGLARQLESAASEITSLRQSMTERDQEMTILREQTSALERRLAEMLEEIAALNKSAAERQVVVGELTQELENSRKHLWDTATALLDSQETSARFEAERATLDRQTEQRRVETEQLRSVLAESEDARDTLQGLLTHAQRELTETLRRIETLEQEGCELRRDIEARAAEEARLREELETARAHARTAEETLGERDKQLAAAQATHRALEEQLAALSARLETNESALAGARAELVAVTESLEQHRTQKQALVDEMNDVQARHVRELAAMDGERGALRERCERLSQSLADAQDRIQALLTGAQQSDQKLIAAERRLAAVAEERDALRSRCESLGAQLADAQAQVERASREVWEKGKLLEGAQRSLENAARERDAAREKHLALMQELDAARESEQRLAQESGERALALEALGHRLETVVHERDVLAERAAAAARELQDAFEQRDQLARECDKSARLLDAAEDRGKALIMERDALRSNHENTEKRLNEAVHRCKRLSDDLEARLSALNAADLQIAALTQERDALREQYQALANETAALRTRYGRLEDEMRVKTDILHQALQRAETLEVELHSVRLEAEIAQRRLAEELAAAGQDKRDLESTLSKSRARITVLTGALETRNAELEEFSRRVAALEHDAEQRQVNHHVETQRHAQELQAALRSCDAFQSALNEARERYDNLAARLKERDAALALAQRRMNELEERGAVAVQELENARKREALLDAERQQTAVERDAALARQRTTALALARAQSEIESLQDALRKQEDNDGLLRRRTVSNLQRALAAIQEETSRLAREENLTAPDAAKTAASLSWELHTDNKDAAPDHSDPDDNGSGRDVRLTGISTK